MGGTVWVRVMMYKAFVQSVLLYGCDSWMVTGAVLKLIDLFHHRLARRITGMTSWRMASEEWEWSPVAEALDTYGIWPTKYYIQRRQDTVASQVVCRPMYDMCTGEERMPVTNSFVWWW